MINNNKFITYVSSNYGKQLRIFLNCSSATILEVRKEKRETCEEEKTVFVISIDKIEREAFQQAINDKGRLDEKSFREAKEKRKTALNLYYDNLVE